MKIFYPSSIAFPTSYVNRLQTLYTAAALANILGNNFELGAESVNPDNGIYSGKIVNFGTKSSVKIAWQTLLHVRKNKFDIIYCREPSILMFIMLLNLIFFRIRLRYFFESHAMPLDPRQDFVIKNSEHVFCVSEGLKIDLHKKFGERSISLLRNGVDLQTYDFRKSQKKNLRMKFGLPEEAFIVSYIGGVKSFGWKGDDVFFDSRKYVNSDNVHFVVAGAKDKELGEIISELGDSSTTILGRLNQEQVAQLEILSDVLVLPNKKGDVESERHTSPIKMFSYMRSETPIIASDLPSIREVLDDEKAFFVEPDNAKHLANMVNYVKNHYEEALEKADKAKQVINEYSWEVKAKKIVTQIDLSV